MRPLFLSMLLLLFFSGCSSATDEQSDVQDGGTDSSDVQDADADSDIETYTPSTKIQGPCMVTKTIPYKFDDDEKSYSQTEQCQYWYDTFGAVTDELCEFNDDHLGYYIRNGWRHSLYRYNYESGSDRIAAIETRYVFHEPWASSPEDGDTSEAARILLEAVGFFQTGVHDERTDCTDETCTLTTNEQVMVVYREEVHAVIPFAHLTEEDATHMGDTVYSKNDVMENGAEHWQWVCPEQGPAPSLSITLEEERRIQEDTDVEALCAPADTERPFQIVNAIGETVSATDFSCRRPYTLVYHASMWCAPDMYTLSSMKNIYAEYPCLQEKLSIVIVLNQTEWFQPIVHLADALRVKAVLFPNFESIGENIHVLIGTHTMGSTILNAGRTNNAFTLYDQHWEEILSTTNSESYNPTYGIVSPLLESTSLPTDLSRCLE